MNKYRSGLEVSIAKQLKKFRIKSFKEEKPIIELKNLTIAYGNRQIVEKLNLRIQKNEISGLLGPNGAG